MRIEGKICFLFGVTLTAALSLSLVKTYKERKLKFLKGMRDDLETRLAGVNATPLTIERQLNQEDTAA